MVSRLVSHPIEVVFTALVVVAFTYSVRITGKAFFFSDEWRLVKQSGSVGGFFRPYNNHLSLVSIVNARVFAEVFGLSYTPFKVVGLLGLFAVPLGYFFTTRRQFGALLAALLAFPLLWYGREISLSAGASNHFFALVGGIGCAAALNRGRRADWALVAALTFALCSAGGGVAVAAACVLHNACTRAPLRRWLAVLGPSLLWFVWYLTASGGRTDLGAFGLSASETVRFVRDIAYTPFDQVGQGNAVLAVALLVAFVGYGIWALSRGLRAGANFLAWSVGLLVWGFGLANGRGVLANVHDFRYRYFALGMALLAVVPRRPIVWPARFPIETNRRWVLAGAGVVLVVGTARGLAVRGEMQAAASRDAAISQVTRGETMTLELGPSVVPDATVMPRTLGSLKAGELRAMFADYGKPLPVARATIDQKLIDMRLVRSVRDGTRNLKCTPLTRAFVYTPVRPFWQFLWSPTRYNIEVRRFGEKWVRLDRVRAGQARRLVLPDLGTDTPYQVRARNACHLDRPNP